MHPQRLILVKPETVSSMAISETIRYEWFNHVGVIDLDGMRLPYAFYCLIQKNKILHSPDLVFDLMFPEFINNPQLN